MRVAWKLAAGMTCGVGVVLAAQGVFHAYRLADLQESELSDDELILSGTLATAVEDIWATSGLSGAQDFLGRVREDWPRSRIQLRTREEVDPRAPLPEAAEITTFQRGELWFVSAAAPVRIHDETVAVLEVSRDLTQDVVYAGNALRQQLLLAMVGALFAGLGSLWLWLRLLGRPLRDLTALAQRVAEGDYSQRSALRRRDDVGKLAQAFDEMSEKLERARMRVKAERRARTQTLEELRHADRLTLVGRLASSIAHELGTPLNVVSGRAMMIATDEALPAEARENGEIIGQQAQHMAGLIRDLLNLSRKKQVAREAQPVRDVVDSAVGLVVPICDDRDVSVTIVGRTDLLAEIHRGKIMQVLTNLMMNATQAMPDGGTISVGIERVEVEDPRDRHASAGTYVCISVTDEGVGIEGDSLEQVFEPFFTTKREGEGTGLGLTVCHGIVREHGGFLDVASEVGRGTTFFVYLPMFEETP
ncbi:MAG: HAMP domain-containing sensor histidine kinase [Polyangiales bacterium]|nr:HAMP domain-containing histidine kinase [Myxococcales bacterium]MCB9659339.1 HAMP domain-containing histidine kinase [Sandaracinaceae bacterium]